MNTDKREGLMTELTTKEMEGWKMGKTNYRDD